MKALLLNGVNNQPIVALVADGVEPMAAHTYMPPESPLLSGSPELQAQLHSIMRDTLACCGFVRADNAIG